LEQPHRFGRLRYFSKKPCGADPWSAADALVGLLFASIDFVHDKTAAMDVLFPAFVSMPISWPIAISAYCTYRDLYDAFRGPSHRHLRTFELVVFHAYTVAAIYLLYRMRNSSNYSTSAAIVGQDGILPLKFGHSQEPLSVKRLQKWGRQSCLQPAFSKVMRYCAMH
jgi:hypothetical protein